MTWDLIFDTRCGIVARRGMASFKAKFPVIQELFAKNHRGPFAPPAGRGLTTQKRCNVSLGLNIVVFTTHLGKGTRDELIVTEALDASCNIPPTKNAKYHKNMLEKIHAASLRICVPTYY